MVNLENIWAETESCPSSQEAYLISHNGQLSFEEAYQEAKKRLEASDNLIIPKEEAIEMLDQLSQFEFGRFVLQNKGLNGYWTSYVILHTLENLHSNSFEEWFFTQLPILKATRNRFKIFQQEIEKRMQDNVVMASIPCGMMDDFILANKEGIQNAQFVGIDLDPSSLVLATENVAKHNLENFSFFKRDAWNLNIEKEFDLIASNGLNVYEPNVEKRKELYANFFKALRPKGILIISYFPPPPSIDKNSPWRNYNSEDIKKQKTLFADIVQVSFQVYCTETEMREHLESVGFKVLEVIYDDQAMMPTVIAERVD